jgi:hypothetical protein
MIEIDESFWAISLKTDDGYLEMDPISFGIFSIE